VNKVITFPNLLDTILMATTAIAPFDVYDQVRVEFVEVWAVPVVGGTAQVAVQFAGASLGLAGDGRVYSDNSMGIEPAHVKCRPDRLSGAGMWQNGAATAAGIPNAFLLTCPVGSVIDVKLSFKTIATQAPVAAGAASVGATVGDIFYRGLDGLAVAGTTLPAVAPVTG